MDFQCFSEKGPKTTVKIKLRALVDLGAQMVVVESKLAFTMGLTKKELLEVDAEVRAANGEVMPCLGGFPLMLSIPDGRGNLRQSKQFSYVVTHPIGLIVGQNYLIFSFPRVSLTRCPKFSLK